MLRLQPAWSFSHARTLAWWFACGAVLMGTQACAQKRELESRYPQASDATSAAAQEVPAGSDAAEKNEPAKPELKAGVDRMLVAVFLRPGEAWFLKAVGAESKLASLQPDFEALAKSLRFEKVPAQTAIHPEWTLPKGWEERPSQGMRWATFVPPGAQEGTGSVPDISLVRLPREGGDLPGYLLANVNRWREQLSLPAWKASDLQSALAGAAVEENTAHLFEFTGTYQGAGIMAGGPGNGDQNGPNSPAVPLPSGHPPVNTGHAAAIVPPPVSAGPGHTPVEYKAPPEWVPLTSGGKRVAAFKIPPTPASTEPPRDGADAEPAGLSGELTLVVLPPGSGDFPAVVGMWEQQLNGETAPPDEVAAEPADSPSPIEDRLLSSGFPCRIVFLSGSRAGGDAPPGAILGAMISLPQENWFLKLTGPAPLVQANRGAFDQFLESLSFGEPASTGP